jgi:NADH dehydrogenase
MYQVAAAEPEPEDIAYPIRSALRKLPAIRFMMADVRAVNLTTRAVKVEDQTIPHDALILAAGSVSTSSMWPARRRTPFP